MKKLSKITVVLLMLVIATFAIIACDSGVEEISISPMEMPARRVYVIGQELDLLGGQLTVKYKNGDVKKVDMQDDEVVIDGFDSKTTGTKTLTVKYKGATCTFTVTVNRRLAFNGADTTYFVGESFDRQKGEFTLTRDDGSIETVGIDQVTLDIPESFGKTAKQENIKVMYGSSFSDDLPITVYAVGSRTPQYPATADREYKSHETSIKLQGSYILYKDPDNKVTKQVPFTEDMLTESATAILSKATFENTNEATEKHTETVHLAYGGYDDYKFDINIEFSDVSFIKYVSDDYLSEIDWNELVASSWAPNNFGLYDLVQAENAILAAQKYHSLKSLDKEYVDVEALENVMRLATYHNYREWVSYITDTYSDTNGDEIEIKSPLGDAFYLTYNGSSFELEMAPTNIEEAEEQIELLKGEKFDEMKVYNNNLWDILNDEDLADIVFYVSDQYGAYTLRQYCIMAKTQSEVDRLVENLEYLITLYRGLDGINLSDVPTNNSNASMDAAKATAIKEIIEGSDTFEGIVNRIYRLVLQQNADSRALYAKLVEWREDYFDVLYQYYWNEIQQAEDSEKESLEINISWLSYCYLPTDLEIYYAATDAAYGIVNSYVNSILVDGTMLYYYYSEVRELAIALANNSNSLYKDIYENVQLLYVNSSTYMSAGYTGKAMFELLTNSYDTYLSGAFGDETIEDFLDDLSNPDVLVKNSYMNLIKNYMSGEYEENVLDEDGEITYLPDGSVARQFTEKFKTDFRAFFDKYLELRPSQQITFINALTSPLLGSITDFADLMMFDIDTSDEKMLWILTQFTKGYFDDLFGDDTVARDVFVKYMKAYESYIRAQQKDHYNAYFALSDEGRTKLQYGIEEFFSFRRLAETGYNQLSSEQKEKVDFLRDKVNVIYSLHDPDTWKFKEITLDEEWQKRFDEVSSYMADSYFAYNNPIQSGNASITFIAYYIYSLEIAEQKLHELYEDINKVSDSELKQKLLNLYTYGGTELFYRMSGISSLRYVLPANWEYVDYTLRGYLYVDILRQNGMYFGKEPLTYYDIYTKHGLKEIVDEWGQLLVDAGYIQMQRDDREKPTTLGDYDETIARYFGYSETDMTVREKRAFILFNDNNTPYSNNLINDAILLYYSFKNPSFFANPNNDKGLAVLTQFLQLVEYQVMLNNIVYYVEDASNIDSDTNTAITTYTEYYKMALGYFDQVYNDLNNVEKATFDSYFGKYIEYYRTLPVVAK